MAQFGVLSTFDHNVQSWETYKCRLTQWFIANDIGIKTDREGTKQRAILLSALTDATYKLATDLALPRNLQEVPYDEIINLLNDHFTPKRCGFTERYNFYAATQRVGESHQQWAARLRGLTAHCGFANVEEALRDRFVMGITPGPERDKLFASDLKELTLAKAVEIAVSIHGARVAAATAAPAAPPSQDHLFKMGRGSASSGNSERTIVKEKCSVCGRNNHKSSQCRYANYKCKKCNNKGHLRNMCKVKYVTTTGDDVSEDDDGKSLNNIRTVRGEPMTESVGINGRRLVFEIDSGAPVTVISDDTYREYFSGVPLAKVRNPLYSYVGGRMECLGVAVMPITYMNMTHALNVHVIRNGGPPLLGRDFLSIFNLQLTPCNFVSNSDKVTIQCNDDVMPQLEVRYPDLFADKLGTFNKYKVKLRLCDNAKPVFYKARPMAFALRAAVDKEIDRLLELGIIEPVEHSEYASPIVPVLKRDGSVRLCADYSVSINKQLIIEHYPLPTVRELFSKLHGGQQYSKLDLSMAYKQLCLHEDSQNITCVNTHRGLFKYTRLVFGLASAPSIFQRTMENLLSGMDGVLCLLDDILITAPNPSLHMERLHAVLQRLQDAGLTVRKDKCEFFKNEIKYLGYVLDKTGLKKAPEKVKAITDAPVPTDVNKLQSFLGLVNYYRNFVPNASAILNPLYDLLKKGSKWTWNREHNNAFVKIKNLLASDQVLAHFNPEANLILTVDASPSGLGAILSQTDSDGVERPISFASRTLNAAEKRYSQIQKEATAIIFGVRRFHQYLYGRSVPFTLRTDHKPLISIFGPYKGVPEVSANRLQRYAIFLSAYNYKIEYIRSADNSADYLSRASLPEPAPAPAMAQCARGDASVQCGFRREEDTGHVDLATYVNFVVEGNLPIRLCDLREETRKDAILSKVTHFVLHGWPNKVCDLHIRPYFLCRTQLSVENDCLMRGHKVVVPEKLRAKILAELHSSHIGIVKTKAEARSRFWYPGIDAALEELIGSCDVCNRLRPSPPRAPLAPWKYPPKPFYRIHIDFLGPLNGHMYLVMVDAYSKWVEVFDMNNNTSSVATIDKIYEFMSRFGLMKTLVSDNAAVFGSYEFQSFCTLNGITHLTSPAYHPASNGQAESYVKIVKKGIKSSVLSSTNNNEARNRLLKYLFDYRNSAHSVTGFSPAQLVFGHKMRSRLDLCDPLSGGTPPTSPPLTSPADNVQRKQCLQGKAYGGHNKNTFDSGDQVLYKKYINKNKFVWCRGTVLRKNGKVMYLVEDHASSSTVTKHQNQMLKYKGSGHLQGNNIIDLDYIPSQEFLHVPARSLEEEGSDCESESRASSPSATTPPTPPPPPTDSRTSRSSRRLLREIPRVDYRSLHERGE